MKISIALALLALLPYRTVTKGDLRKTMVIRNSHIIVAYTDGYLCYGTSKPLAVSCERTIHYPAYKEIQ